MNACNETTIYTYLQFVYSVTIPLHVSGLLVAQHQEVTMYVCNNWYVLYALVDCRLNIQHVPLVAYLHCYLLIMGNNTTTCRGIVTE
jgi:hypothetical protein